MSQPSKGEQIKALIKKLRETLQQVAGGTHSSVQAVLGEMEEVLTPQKQPQQGSKETS